VAVGGMRSGWWVLALIALLCPLLLTTVVADPVVESMLKKGFQPGNTTNTLKRKSATELKKERRQSDQNKKARIAPTPPPEPVLIERPVLELPNAPRSNASTAQVRKYAAKVHKAVKDYEVGVGETLDSAEEKMQDLCQQLSVAEQTIDDNQKLIKQLQLCRSVRLPQVRKSHTELSNKRATMRIQLFADKIDEVAKQLKIDDGTLLLSVYGRLWAAQNTREGVSVSDSDGPLLATVVQVETVMEAVRDVERHNENDDEKEEGRVKGGLPLFEALKLMDNSGLSHKKMHELLTTLSVTHVNDNQLKKAEKQLNLACTDLLGVQSDNTMTWCDPQRLLDFLVGALDITSAEVHVLYGGDGRTYGGRYSNLSADRGYPNGLCSP
jgi:hypothetical protein